jgi:hypothetical protein
MNRIDLEGSGATSVLAESYCLITDRSRMLFGGQPCVHGRKRAGLVLIWGRLWGRLYRCAATDKTGTAEVR